MLTLPIKRHWFDMIEAGEKGEEYRDITPYYFKRFMNAPKYEINGHTEFSVILRAGYGRGAPRILITCWLDTGEGRPEWGAEPGKEYFRLHITGRTKLKETDRFKGR